MLNTLSALFAGAGILVGLACLFNPAAVGLAAPSMEAAITMGAVPAGAGAAAYSFTKGE